MYTPIFFGATNVKNMFAGSLVVILATAFFVPSPFLPMTLP